MRLYRVEVNFRRYTLNARDEEAAMRRAIREWKKDHIAPIIQVKVRWLSERDLKRAKDAKTTALVQTVAGGV